MQSYRQNPAIPEATRFSSALFSNVEHSRMIAAPVHWSTFNAGDIVPIYCREVLPHESLSIDVDFVIRQTTLLAPTMDNMTVDIYAFFVQNRVVNESWVNVMGENTSGSWVAPEVSLAPLYTGSAPVRVPVGSVADYYSFPTQQDIPASVLQSANDLRFRGYLEIYNTRFRDQNYQSAIPYSKLNVYEGFFDPVGSFVSLTKKVSSSATEAIGKDEISSDGSYPKGAVGKALYGEGVSSGDGVVTTTLNLPTRKTTFSALGKPLKANKLHDYFTSGLPSPQKGPEVTLSFTFPAQTIVPSLEAESKPFKNTGILRFHTNSYSLGDVPYFLGASATDPSGSNPQVDVMGFNASNPGSSQFTVDGWNLDFSIPEQKLPTLSLSELRQGAAIQQVYEILARGGSRYREYVASFFGIEAENPYNDIPDYLGHIRRDLDLYQTAQTSGSVEGGTPQGNLAAFGYTAKQGQLFHKTFLEHGYVHIFAVVRHKNVYASFMPRDLFRRNMLDFYSPPLANLSEQPVFTREINPFYSDPEAVFAYQEAWAEYRMEVDQVSGYMRPGVSNSLALWNYADEFDSDIAILDDEFLKSNSQEILDRTLAVQSDTAPQFKAMFKFKVDKDLPMPTYSVPGLDVL